MQLNLPRSSVVVMVDVAVVETVLDSVVTTVVDCVELSVDVTVVDGDVCSQGENFPSCMALMAPFSVLTVPQSGVVSLIQPSASQLSSACMLPPPQAQHTSAAVEPDGICGGVALHASFSAYQVQLWPSSSAQRFD